MSIPIICYTENETAVIGTNTVSVHLQHMHPGHAALAMAGHPTAALPHPHLAASPVLGSPLATSTGSPVSSVSLGGAGGQASTHTVPCSTLFVANLGPFCSEQELKDLFSRYCHLCVCLLLLHHRRIVDFSWSEQISGAVWLDFCSICMSIYICCTHLITSDCAGKTRRQIFLENG